MPSTFPATDFDRPGAMLALLGTFWSRVYAPCGEPAATLQGTGALYRQLAKSFDEAAALSYATMPLLHVEDWSRFSALASTTVPPPASYGGGAVCGDGTAYGRPAAPAVSWPLPLGGAASVMMLCDSPVSPSVALSLGVDYTVDSAGTAWLAFDPFQDARFSPVPVHGASGAVVDSEIVFWGWRASYDERALQGRLGAVLGAAFPSTETARAAALALWECALKGSSELAARRWTAALYDIPLARGGETVTAIAADAAGPFIVTTSNTYRHAATAAPVVAVGDALAAGQPVTSSIAFGDCRDGTAPPWLQGAAVAGASLGAAPTGEAVFPAAPVPVTTAGPDDAPAVSWPVGAPDVAEAFWERADRSAAGAPPALAAALSGGAAAPYAVPAETSPLGFLAANFWRGATWAARVAFADRGPNALPALGAALFAPVPPEVLPLFQLETPPIADNGAAPGADGPAAPCLTTAVLVETGGPNAPAREVFAAAPAPLLAF